MKKKEKTVCQIIRFRGKIEAFFISIDEFAISSTFTLYVIIVMHYVLLLTYLHSAFAFNFICT